MRKSMILMYITLFIAIIYLLSLFIHANKYIIIFIGICLVLTCLLACWLRVKEVIYDKN